MDTLTKQFIMGFIPANYFLWTAIASGSSHSLGISSGVVVSSNFFLFFN